MQTLFFACLNLMAELDELQHMGIGTFRISPHSHDMHAVIRTFRAVLAWPRRAPSAEAGSRRLAAEWTNGRFLSATAYKGAVFTIN